MSTATNIITLALNTSGVLGVGQTPQSQDINDAFASLNAMIYQWQYQRTIAVIPGALPAFPDLTTDVPFWDSRESVLTWNLSVRLRPLFGMPEDEQQSKLAAAALATLQANNKQAQPAPANATTDITATGLCFLALRAAGRIDDAQGVDPASQDAVQAFLLLVEMLDEWQRDRTVTVTPGTFPVPALPTDTLAVTPGLRAAIVWGLAVRIRSAFGLDENKDQTARADRALAAIQANNKQQQPPLSAGPTGTAANVIFLALRMAGRITDAQSVALGSQDVDDALQLLNAMVAQWSKERWLVYDLDDVSLLSTGAAAYSIGPGGAFDVPRPDRIESAFVRFGPRSTTTVGIDGDFSPADFSPDFFLATETVTTDIAAATGIDYPLEVLQSREDYNAIAYKGLTTFPSAIFYDSNYPTGTIYVYPVPQAGTYEIHLSVKATLPNYQLTTALGLPPEYTEALITNLACRVMMLTGAQPSIYLQGQARKTLQTIRGANLQIPVLQMPSGLPGTVRSFGGGFAAAYALGAVYPSPVGAGGAPASSGGTATSSPGGVARSPDALADDAGNFLTDDAGQLLLAG